MSHAHFVVDGRGGEELMRFLSSFLPNSGDDLSCLSFFFFFSSSSIFVFFLRLGFPGWLLAVVVVVVVRVFPPSPLASRLLLAITNESTM